MVPNVDVYPLLNHGFWGGVLIFVRHYAIAIICLALLYLNMTCFKQLNTVCFEKRTWYMEDIFQPAMSTGENWGLPQFPWTNRPNWPCFLAPNNRIWPQKRYPKMGKGNRVAAKSSKPLVLGIPHLVVSWNLGTLKSSISRWDFQCNKPSSYWGTPMTMETPILRNTQQIHPNSEKMSTPRSASPK